VLSQAVNQRHTYAQYATWDDAHRWELLNGVAHGMSPAPSIEHQRMVGGLFAQIQAFLQDGPCEALLSPLDVVLPEPGATLDEATTVVQPDLLVVCDDTKLESRGCIGAPDWIVEVLSPATATRDQGVKRGLYAHHGVLEYWLVHPIDRVLFVYRLNDAGCYGAPEVRAAEGRQAVGLFPDLLIDWDDIFARFER